MFFLLFLALPWKVLIGIYLTAGWADRLNKCFETGSGLVGYLLYLFSILNFNIKAKTIELQTIHADLYARFCIFIRSDIQQLRTFAFLLNKTPSYWPNIHMYIWRSSIESALISLVSYWRLCKPICWIRFMSSCQHQD